MLTSHMINVIQMQSMLPLIFSLSWLQHAVYLGFFKCQVANHESVCCMFDFTKHVAPSSLELVYGGLKANQTLLNSLSGISGEAREPWTVGKPRDLFIMIRFACFRGQKKEGFPFRWNSSIWLAQDYTAFLNGIIVPINISILPSPSSKNSMYLLLTLLMISGGDSSLCLSCDSFFFFSLILYLI